MDVFLHIYLFSCNIQMLLLTSLRMLTGCSLSTHADVLVALLPVHGRATATKCSSANRTFPYETACTANPKCFQHYWDETDTPAALTSHVSRLQPPQLAELTSSLGVAHSNEQGLGFGEGFLVHMLVRRYQRRKAQHEAINSLPLYPDKVVPWDSAQLPELDHTGHSCLALPKLNLQVSPNHLTLALTLALAVAVAVAVALTRTL